MSIDTRLTRIRRLYSRIPPLKCKGKCAAACGVIFLQGAEYEAIAAKRPVPAVSPGHLSCPMLRAGRCSVYDVRPLICRLWGSIKEGEWMRCPHGCEPERWLSPEEAEELIHEAMAIDPRQRALQSWADGDFGAWVTAFNEAERSGLIPPGRPIGERLRLR